jgi:ABC-2 type transport system ATP-binding protein
VTTPAAPPRLAVRALRKRFGAVEAVRDATFDVRPGEVVGLLGPNGAGKSTILECLAGLLPADGGDVEGDGRPLSSAARRDALFFLPDGLTPWADETAGEVLDLAAALWRTPHEARRAWADDAAAALRVDELRDRRVGALSKGQRKRVLVALALLVPRPLLLMDEPFDGLDLRQTREAIALFRRVAAAGRSLLVSVHAMRDAERACDRLVLVSDGRTVAEGAPDELRARAGLPEGDLEDVFLALA